MSFTLEQMLDLVGTLTAVGSALFVVVRYLLGVMDTREARIRGELEARTAARVAGVAELHRRVDEVVKEHGNHREYVARTYATLELMRDMEDRITKALGQAEARITAQISRLDRRLDRGTPSAGD